MAKKKINPFSMSGSYIGGLIGYMLGIINVVQSNIKFLSEGATNIQRNILTSPEPLILLVVGFLIGWGIHILIRKFK